MVLLDECLEIKEEDVILDDRFYVGIYGIFDDEIIVVMKCELVFVFVKNC